MKKRHTNGQQAHEKMLDIINHQRNAIKTMSYHLSPVRMLFYFLKNIFIFQRGREKERELETSMMRKNY